MLPYEFFHQFKAIKIDPPIYAESFWLPETPKRPHGKIFGTLRQKIAEKEVSDKLFFC